jgi:Fe-S-cluster containining protein
MDLKRICALECGARCCTNSGEILLREGEGEKYLALAKQRGVDLKLVDGLSGSQYIPLPCPFLENGTLCSIHDQKPEPCKTYPWKKMDGCMVAGWTPPPQVYIGVPRGNRHDDEWEASYEAMLEATSAKGMLIFPPVTMRSCRVDNNRNAIGMSFLKESTADFLLMVDDDMQFDPETAIMLTVAAIANNCPIIGGVYFQRAHGRVFPHVYMSAGVDPNDSGEVGYRFSSEGPSKVLFDAYMKKHIATNSPQIVQGMPLLKVDATGTGCILIRRDVLEQTPYPWFRNEYGTGGDLMFCVKAKRVGFQTYTAAGIICSHSLPGAVATEAFIDDYVSIK